MAEKKGKGAAVKPVEELLMMQARVQVSKTTQLVIAWPKVQLEKPNLKETQEEAVIGGSPFLTADKFWWRRAPGAVQVKLPLVAPMYVGASPHIGGKGEQ